MHILFEMKKLLSFFSLIFIFVFVQIFADNFRFEQTFIIILYLSITLLSKNFMIRYDTIFAPQNIAFIIFFIRLYILPLLSLFYDYKNAVDINSIDFEVIFNSYVITLVMYFSFVIGWEINCYRKKKRNFICIR